MNKGKKKKELKETQRILDFMIRKGLAFRTFEIGKGACYQLTDLGEKFNEFTEKHPEISPEEAYKIVKKQIIS